MGSQVPEPELGSEVQPNFTTPRDFAAEAATPAEAPEAETTEAETTEAAESETPTEAAPDNAALDDDIELGSDPDSQ